jgi:hypothetical protein
MCWKNRIAYFFLINIQNLYNVMQILMLFNLYNVNIMAAYLLLKIV